MDPFDFPAAAPRRLTVPIAAALGLALGFYPRPCPAGLSLGAAFCLAGFASFLRGLPRLRGAGGGVGGGEPRVGPDVSSDRASADRAARAWAGLSLAAAIGLVAGLGLARDDEARELFAASPLMAGGVSGASAGGASGPAAFRVTAVEGCLSADSAAVKGGMRSYPLSVLRIAIEGAVVRGELYFPGVPKLAMRVLVRGGPALDAGARLRAAGSLAAGGGALFASAPDARALDEGSPIDRARSTARSALRKAVARAGRRSAGLLEALLLGSRDGLDGDVAEAFKAAGCSHILALSGQHLSVLALLVVACLKPLAGPLRARLGAAAAAAAFTWLAGPAPSLLRAAIMAWIGAITAILDRPQDWLGLLALCFIIALPLDSAGARSLGFLLSYLAVAGLALLSPRFEFLLSPVLPPAICAAAAASLGAQAATSPLMAFGFGSLQLMGVLASMASAPLVAAFMWWGMGAAALCAIVPGAAAAAASVSDLIYDALVGVMRAAAAVPPITLPGVAQRVAASAAVALLAGLAYAWPWLAYERSRRRRGRGQEPPVRVC